MSNIDEKKFNRILSDFSKAKILVIGDVMLDRFMWGTVSRISPEAPVPVVWIKSESFMPGGASNVANNICAHNASCYICGVIGDDLAGNLLLEELVKKGINSEGIVLDNARPTVEKTRIIAHHQQVVRIDKESDGAISSNIIKKIISFTKAKLDEIDAVIIEDYGKGVITPALLKQIISLCRKHNKMILVDPKREHFAYYKGITIMTPNRKEAEEASGIKIKDPASLVKAGKKLLKMLNAQAILITLGEDGMALFQKSGWTHIPTVAQEVYDVSGAGDTVIGTFALAKSSGADMREAAYISNIAGGVVVGKLGIAVCTTDELRAHFKQIQKYGIKSKKISYPSDSIFKR